MVMSASPCVVLVSRDGEMDTLDGAVERETLLLLRLLRETEAVLRRESDRREGTRETARR
jgi:hypothetical protein